MRIRTLRACLVLVFENCFCYLNLVFSLFFVFLRVKKMLGTKQVISVFLVLFVFEKRTIFKNRPLTFFCLCIFCSQMQKDLDNKCCFMILIGGKC